MRLLLRLRLLLRDGDSPTEEAMGVLPYADSSVRRADVCCSGVVGSKRWTQKSSARCTSFSVRRFPISALPWMTADPSEMCICE